jgi:hypothetical protein
MNKYIAFVLLMFTFCTKAFAPNKKLQPGRALTYDQNRQLNYRPNVREYNTAINFAVAMETMKQQKEKQSLSFLQSQIGPQEQSYVKLIIHKQIQARADLLGKKISYRTKKSTQK